jgi:hypothetical protein
MGSKLIGGEGRWNPPKWGHQNLEEMSMEFIHKTGKPTYEVKHMFIDFRPFFFALRMSEYMKNG